MEEEAKKFAGSTLAMKSVRLQTEYLGAWKTKANVHEVPVDINGDRLETFFARYGEVLEGLGNNKQS